MSAKTPERTLAWSRRCIFIDKEMDHYKRLPNGPEREAAKADLLDYTTASRDIAQREGYDDTATYLQHILDDLGT